jgi:hypothetical protein
MKYQFKQSMAADTPTGTKQFRAGDVIGDKDILPGCLASCIYTGAVCEHTVPAAPAPKAQESTPPATPAKQPEPAAPAAKHEKHPAKK